MLSDLLHCMGQLNFLQGLCYLPKSHFGDVLSFWKVFNATSRPCNQTEKKSASSVGKVVVLPA